MLNRSPKVQFKIVAKFCRRFVVRPTHRVIHGARAVRRFAQNSLTEGMSPCVLGAFTVSASNRYRIKHLSAKLSDSNSHHRVAWNMNGVGWKGFRSRMHMGMDMPKDPEFHKRRM